MRGIVFNNSEIRQMALLRLDAQERTQPLGAIPGLRSSVRSYLPSLIAAAVGIALSFAAYLAMTHIERENETIAVSRRVNASVSALEAQVAHYVNIGIGVRALFAATSGHVTRDEFHIFAKEILSATPEVWSVGFIERVRGSDRAAFELRRSDPGEQGHRILDRTSEGQLVSAAERDEYYVLNYLESRNRTPINTGVDLGAIPGRQAWFHKVVASGRPTIMCELALADRPGFVVVVPIYRSSNPPESAVERDAQLLGFANVTLMAENVTNAALGPANVAALDLYLYDNIGDGPRFFYGRGAGGEQLRLEPNAALAQASAAGSVRQFAVVGREWTAAFLPRFSLRPFDRRWTAPLTLALGLTLSALIAGYLFLLIDRARRIGNQVALRTSELRKANRALEIEIAERRAAENQAAAERGKLLDAINSIPNNFLLWDSSDRLLLWNEWAARSFRSLGHSAILRVGISFDEFIADAPRRISDHEGPANEEQWIADRKRAHRIGGVTGEIKLRSGRWLYISEYKTKDGGTATLYADVTERKIAERQLREANRILETLIHACPLPICVADQENRVELWNPAAERTFGWTAEEVIGKSVPYLPYGRPRRGMVRGLVAREGKLIGMEDLRIRKDGKTLAVEVFAAPLRNDVGEITRLLVVSVDITQRKEAEAALRASEERYRELIARAPDAMIVHDGEQVLFANEAAARLYGVATPDVLIQVGDPLQLLHPEDRAKVAPGRRQGLAGRRLGPPEEVRWIARNGNIVHIEASSTPVEWDGKPCILLEARDITERKRAENARREAEDALRESESRYRHLIEVSPDAIFVHVDERIRFANDAAAKLMGANSPEDIIGRPVTDHIDPEHIPAFENYKMALNREGRVTIHEIKWRRRDGTPIFIDGSAGLFTFQGEPATQLIARDVTARKAAETVMREAKEAAEAANRSKSEFLANVSHELRTPLNAIIGFSEVMEHEMFGKLGNEHYRDYARDIRLSGAHLLEVINDILDLAKVEAGKVELQEQSIDVGKVTEATVRLVRERASGRNIDVSIRLPDNLPRLWGDERKIKQILINLLSNAVKFTPEGGSVTVSADRSTADGIQIAVSDTGIGIPREALETVLQPFGQVDSALSRKHAGTGLGLPLTKSLVELHGGRLDLESELGKGTTVTVRFPPERLVA
jgi:PAS domain S-box-containing protein